MKEEIEILYCKRKFEYGCFSIYIQRFITDSPYKICRLYYLINKSRFLYVKYAEIHVPVFLMGKVGDN